MATTFTMANLGTYQRSLGGPTKKYKWKADTSRAQIVLEKLTIDFDDYLTDVTGAYAANDVIPIFNIEAGETVLVAGFNITTAATGAADMDIGTGDDTDGFIDGIEANDTTPTVVAAPFGLLSGTRFASADTVDIKVLTAAITGCVSDFWVLKLRIG